MSGEETKVEESFGAIIKRERDKQGLSLNKLSAKLDGTITASYINRLEAGDKQNPSFNMVCALASALSLDFREILKVFGYEHLLNTNSSVSAETIEDLIRLNNVKAPVGIDGNQNLVTQYLKQPEKEQLLTVIDRIYGLSIDDLPDKLLLQIPILIEEIVRFREMRQESITIKKREKGNHARQQRLFEDSSNNLS